MVICKEKIQLSDMISVVAAYVANLCGVGLKILAYRSVVRLFRLSGCTHPDRAQCRRSCTEGDDHPVIALCFISQPDP